MGGADSNGNAINSMEVFDSQRKQITKVMDNQNNWVQVPVNYIQDMTASCAVSLIDKNAFILSGGRNQQNYFADVVMFHTDTR